MTDTVKYEVDDKVEDQLKSLNKGMLAKPQFWLILALIAVVAFLLYRRQQKKKELQSQEGQAFQDEENVEQFQDQNQVPADQEEVAPQVATDERVVEESDDENKKEIV